MGERKEKMRKKQAKIEKAEEKKTKHDVIMKEGYQKGVENTRAIYDAQQKKKAKKEAVAQATKKAATVEQKAKALLKVANKVKTENLSPEQSQARKLVREAVATTAVNHDTNAAVDHASHELKSFLKSQAGVDAEKQERKEEVDSDKIPSKVDDAEKAVAK